MNPHSRIRQRTALALIMAAIPLYATANGSEENTQKDAATELSQPGVSGMLISRDPETGLLRAPTAEERQALGLYQMNMREALRRDDDGLEDTTLADGTVIRDLKGRFQSMSVATRSEDGTLHTLCSDEADHLHHAMEHGVQPRKQEIRDER